MNPWGMAGYKDPTSEISLRDEIAKILHGKAFGMEAHGTTFIHRRMRHNEKGGLIYCNCSDNPQLNSPKNLGNVCRFCDGEGALYDEQFIVGYFTYDYPNISAQKATEFGTWNPNAPVLFVEYFVEIDERDIILEPLKDTEGRMVSPIRIDRRFVIANKDVERSDNGRIEYIRLRLTQRHQHP